MGKTTNTSDVLKNILKDVSNVQDIIDDSKKLEKIFSSVDFDNALEVEKVVEATKAILDNLKAQTLKIHSYFEINYNSWDFGAKAQANNNNDCDMIENDGNDEPDVAKMNDDECTVNGTEERIENDSEKSDSAKTMNEESTASEPKLFLKCVDINKLINPDILPHLTSPKPLQTVIQTNNCDDTVLIISDSDDDTVPKKKRGNTNRAIRSRVVSRNTTVKANTKYDKRKFNENLCTSESDSQSSQSVCSKRSNLRRRTTAPKKYKEISESDVSSTSNSDSDERSSVSRRGKRNTRERRSQNKTRERSKNNTMDEDLLKDKKLSYKTYVRLPRIKCEKLKEYYLDEKDVIEVNRLTDLKNLKKRNRKNSNDSSSSANSEKSRSQSKRSRKVSTGSSGSSNNSDADVPKENNEDSTVLHLDVEDAGDKAPEDTETTEVLNDVLNKLSSDSDKEEKSAEDEEKESEPQKDEEASKKDKDSSESETENANANLSTNSKETEKEDGNASDKHSDDDKNEESGDEPSEKQKNTDNNWRKDKLLTGKLSGTDTEDEFENFKKDSEKAKLEAKASPAKDLILQPIIKIKRIKKKTKKVISSDSEPDKKKSSSEDESENEKKSSSSSSEKEEEEQQESKKRRRIKTVRDSSDEEGDKSTRKTIRRVIGRDSLAESTKRAEQEERERKQRISDRQKKYNKIFDCDKPTDATIDKLVLDFNEDTREELLTVTKDLVKVLKPHQGKGIQFMWDACFESMDRAKSTEGSGCILAHCMGLGKTLQVIALTHSLLTNEDTKVSKVLVVCPLNTVLNWSAEYKRWLENVEGAELDVYDLVSCKQNHREFVVDDWNRTGGVLIIGYDMFRNVTNPNNKRVKKKARESFQTGLVNPGPDMVICDEGHLLKNEKTNLSIAMNRIRTARRIVLTGTPMQNNLKEYYCMVQFVKPNLLGTYKEYVNRFVNPITNGQYTDSTSHDINVMRRRSHVLHKLLDGVVQRKDYSVLTPFLPPKHEYVLFLTLSDTQINLYEYYLKNLSQRLEENKLKSAFLFADFQELQRICTHPRSLLLKSLQERNKIVSDDEEEDESEGSIKDFIDDDSEAKSTSSSSGDSSDSDASIKSKDSKSAKKSGKQPRLTRTSAAASGIDIDQVVAVTKQSNSEWWRQFCDGDELDNIQLSSKLFLLFEILQECELIGDKLLVFSQSLYSLNIIEHFLARIDDATQQGDQSKVSGFSGSWTLGLDYFRLDGSSSCDNRAVWCKNFNNIENPRARLFLISTKAGGLGINLVGANRVIIFDVSWNPSHDTQSIYRVYRFGQTKPCYIYRFVIWGTMEMKIYERQVTKQAISKRVIDEQQIDRHYNQNDLAELYNFDPRPGNQSIPLVPKDVLLAELLQKQKDRIYQYHEHQSLLENKEDEELNEDERKAAWEEFENEKTRITTSSNMMWIGDLPLQSVHMAVTNIIRNDNPGWTQDQVRRLVPLIIQQVKQQVEAGEMMLFQRIANEVKQIQEIQQAKMQEYIRQQQQQQQLRVLQHFQNQMMLQRGLGLSNNPNEVVELND